MKVCSYNQPQLFINGFIHSIIYDASHPSMNNLAKVNELVNEANELRGLCNLFSRSPINLDDEKGVKEFFDIFLGHIEVQVTTSLTFDSRAELKTLMHAYSRIILDEEITTILTPAVIINKLKDCKNRILETRRLGSGKMGKFSPTTRTFIYLFEKTILQLKMMNQIAA